MKRLFFTCLFVLAVLWASFVVPGTSKARAVTSNCVQASSTQSMQGTINGANYLIEVPSHWNDKLLLYSHGYQSTLSPLLNPAPDAPDATSEATLLTEGYALAGSSFSQNGWAVQQALQDQINLLHYFETTCGQPMQIFAWGGSMGGLITDALIEQNPTTFAGALPICGAVAGGVRLLNQFLDIFFAFNVLADSNLLQLTGLNGLTATTNSAAAVLALLGSQLSAQGKARIALAAAMSDLPGWSDSAQPPPASTDYASQESNQESVLLVEMPFMYQLRADIEARAGGNVSWNTGINYSQQLQNSVDNAEVQALYQQAGLNLQKDLNTLALAPRITANLSAVNYLNTYYTPGGNIRVPVLTVHTIADTLVSNQTEQNYASVVSATGNGSLLHEIFVNRAGHCTFTPAETLTAFHSLVQRVDTGTWGSLEASDLNNVATALGSSANILSGTSTPPAFLDYTPAPYLRS